MQWFEVKNALMIYLFIISSFSLYKMLTDGLEWCGLLVDYCDVFYQLLGLSFWRHPFTAEDPLVSRWCNATFIQMKKHTLLFLGWPEGELTFSKFSFLGWTIALTQNVQSHCIRYKISKGLVFILKKDITSTLFKQDISMKNIYCTVVPIKHLTSYLSLKALY